MKRRFINRLIVAGTLFLAANIYLIICSFSSETKKKEIVEYNMGREPIYYSGRIIEFGKDNFFFRKEVVSGQHLSAQCSCPSETVWVHDYEIHTSPIKVEVAKPYSLHRHSSDGTVTLTFKFSDGRIQGFLYDLNTERLYQVG